MTDFEIQKYAALYLIDKINKYKELLEIEREDEEATELYRNMYEKFHTQLAELELIMKETK